MTKNLIILTTAITRGDFHNNTIGFFYNELSEYLYEYKIIHIINIDHPLKLRSFFNKEETIKILNNIIPSNVEKIIIQQNDDNPSFSKAYKKVINAMKESIYLNDDSIIWWLEDDWKLTNNYNFIPLLKLLDNKYNSALNISRNSPLCSFRAGPIMNGYFFKSYFDISNNTNEFNPEEKVSRNISMNRSISVYEDNFYIICLFIINKVKFPYSMKEACYWHYKRKYKNIKFSKDKKIKYIIGCLENNKSEFFYYKQGDNADKLNIINQEEMYELNKIHFKEINNQLKSSLIYITIVPQINVDENVGRNFNKKYNIGVKK